MLKYKIQMSDLDDEMRHLCNRLADLPRKDGVEAFLMMKEEGSMQAVLVRPAVLLLLSNLIAGMVNTGLDPEKILNDQLALIERSRKDPSITKGPAGTNEDLKEYLRAYLAVTR